MFGLGLSTDQQHSTEDETKLLFLRKYYCANRSLCIMSRQSAFRFSTAFYIGLKLLGKFVLEGHV
jgi:hypothetical protein